MVIVISPEQKQQQIPACPTLYANLTIKYLTNNNRSSVSVYSSFYFYTQIQRDTVPSSEAQYPPYIPISVLYIWYALTQLVLSKSFCLPHMTVAFCSTQTTYTSQSTVACTMYKLYLMLFSDCQLLCFVFNVPIIFIKYYKLRMSSCREKNHLFCRT